MNFLSKSMRENDTRKQFKIDDLESPIMLEALSTLSDFNSSLVMKANKARNFATKAKDQLRTTSEVLTQEINFKEEAENKLYEITQQVHQERNILLVSILELETECKSKAPDIHIRYVRKLKEYVVTLVEKSLIDCHSIKRSNLNSKTKTELSLKKISSLNVFNDSFQSVSLDSDKEDNMIKVFTEEYIINLGNLKKNMTKNLSRFEKERKVFEEQSSALLEEITEANKQIENLKLQLEHSSGSNKSLLHELSVERETGARREQRLLQDEEALEKLKIEILHLNVEHQNEKIRRNESDSAVLVLKSEMSDLKKKLEEQSASTAKLKNDISQHENIKKQSDSVLQAKLEEIDKLKQNLEKAQNEINYDAERLQTVLEVAYNERDAANKLRTDLNNLVAENEELKNGSSAALQTNYKYLTEITSLQAELLLVRKGAAFGGSAQGELEQKLQKLELERDFEERLASLQSANRALEQENRSLQDDAERLRGLIQEQAAIVKAALQNRDSSEQLKAAVESEHVALEQQQLKAQLLACQSELLAEAKLREVVTKALHDNAVETAALREKLEEGRYQSQEEVRRLKAELAAAGSRGTDVGDSGDSLRPASGEPLSSDLQESHATVRRLEAENSRLRAALDAAHVRLHRLLGKRPDYR